MKTNRLKPIPTLIAAACLLAASQSFAATSLVLTSGGGWNGFFLEAEIQAGYRPAGAASGTGEIFASDSGFLGVAPDVHGPGDVLTLVSTTTGLPLAANFLPITGSGKDLAQGDLAVSFDIGTLTSADAFQFALNSTTSAETVQVDFGGGLENADAFFRATISLRSFAPAIIPGATIRVPDLPSLDDPLNESMTATVSFYQAGVLTSGFFLPGNPGADIPLDLANEGEEFKYQLNYEITTPFGTDPTINYTLNGGSQVPEPGVVTLLALATLPWLGRRRTMP